MKTTTVVTSLTRRAAARFIMIVVSYLAPSINQLPVAIANERKTVTRLAIFGTNLRRALTLAAIIAIGAATGPTPAVAAVITVSNTADNGAGSLRAALASANDGDTIDATGVTGTVTLTSGQLNVTDSVKILGPGADMLALNGNFAGRVFYIGPGINVTIAGLTITNGSASGSFPAGSGAGIFNDHSTLAVSNCAISGNSAEGSGGGVYNDGRLSGSATLTILDSSVIGNSADAAGGIGNDGTGGNAMLTVIGSTFSGNSASAGPGGGIFNDAAFSGIATLTVFNSTFSGNRGRFSGPGGGGGDIASSAMLMIGSTILNSGGIGNSGFVTSLGYNLSSAAEGGDGTTAPGGWLNAPGDIRNTNPMLGPLQDNGGPTLTHAPLCGSPAIDAGKNFSVSATDQRGAQRTFDLSGIANATGGDGTDIGAVESPVSVFTVLNTNNSGAGSLRQAILDANASPGTDIIDFDVGVTGTITLTSGELLITDCLFIDGPGANIVAVNGNAASRVFHIGPGINVTIAGLTITNGLASGSFPVGSGAGIFNDHSTLAVRNCAISGNSAAFSGGGVHNDGHLSGSAMLTILDSSLIGNSAGGDGGGILNAGHAGNAILTVIGSTFSGNSAYAAGGIGNETIGGSATLTVVNSTFSGNAAASIFAGSDIRNDGYFGVATLNIGSTILNSTSQNALLNFGGTVTSLGYNLSRDGTGPNNGTTDRINTDPLLGPLQDNGGPTLTHALLPGSPAINAGDPAFDSNAFTPPMDFDQRGTGFPRVVGGRIDIGAFELPPPNTAPTVQCPVASVFDCAPATGLSVQIHASVTDLDNGQTLTVALKEGSATLDTQIAQPTPLNNAGVTFNPVTLLPGVHSLTIEVSDGIAIGSCNTSVTINPDTTAPAAPTLANATGECSVTVSAPTATDTCAGTVTGTTLDPLTYSSQGTFTVHWTFNDGKGNSSTANQTVIVHDTVAPVANSQSVSAAQNMPNAITLNATDNCNPSLTYTVVTPPSHGGLTGTAPNLTYTPASNYAGPDSFQFKANDGVQDSSVATISIAVNHPPVAKPQTVLPLEDTAKPITLTATDADGNTLTYSIVAGPAHGTLSGFNPNTGAVTYTPAANYYGSDSFTFKANDGTVDSNVAVVSIDVTPVNDAPSFNKGSKSTVLEDAGAQTVNGWATSISAGPANESGQAVNFLVSNNNNALFSVQPAVNANGRLTYTPAANAHGSATVTVRIHDNGGTTPGGGIDTSPAQTFTISVIEVNDVPSFIKGANQSVQKRSTAVTSTVSNWATSIRAGPANESGQTVNFLVSNNNNGLFTTTGQPAIAANGTLSFTPKANTIGVATVTVRIHDNVGTANGGVDTSATQTFTITVHL